MKKIPAVVFLFVLSVSLFPFGVFAQKVPTNINANPAVRTGPDGGIGSNNPADTNNFQLVTCSGVDDPKTAINEECTYEQLILTARRIIYFVIFLISPILVAMIVYTGFKYMTAGGDAKLIADAKRMFTPILLGLFFIFGAWIIVYTVLDKLLGVQIGDIPKSSIVPNTIK